MVSGEHFADVFEGREGGGGMREKLGGYESTELPDMLLLAGGRGRALGEAGGGGKSSS